jgi:predicted dehydrogenase
MLKLGVIGTNWITESFVKAAISTNKYQLTSVYSRTVEKAKEFGAKYLATNYLSDINAFMSLDDLDVVYIASPNSLHFEHSRLALQAGKHVIVEKPAFSNSAEMDVIRNELSQGKVLLFEAAKHIHEANYSILKEKLKEIGKIEGANFTFMKYSSRYDSVLEGEEPNIFSTKYSGGALVDLGIYLVYTAVELFGVPKETFYFHRKIRTQVDGIGTIIFRYEDFDVTMQTGKIADSFLPCEIYGSKETLSLDAMSTIGSIEGYCRQTKQKKQYALEKPEHDMAQEAIAYAEMIEHKEEEFYQKKYEYYLELSTSVNKLMSELRKKEGIHFKADQEQ